MHPPDDGGLCLYLLGRFEVRSGDRLIIDQSWPRRKAKALLKLLALNRGRWLHREQILDTLWPDLEPAAADHNLRQNLHYLRQAFADHGLPLPVETADRATLALSACAATDVDAFRESAQAARRVRTDPDLYEQALVFYFGDLAPEDIYEQWTESDREELKTLRRQLLFELALLHEVHGRREEAAKRLEELVRLDPLDEEGHRALIRLHAASGDRQRAVRQYEKCRDAIRKGLGVDPAEETELLYREALGGKFEAVTTDTVGGVFIGRAREIGRLADGLAGLIRGRGQLFVLAGEAGIGKTRIAEQFAVMARLRGADVLWGRCYEGDGVPAYWPWVQVLRDFARNHSSDEVRALAGIGAAHISSLLPELRAGQLDFAAGPAGESNRSRFQLFDSLATFLFNAAGRRPLVVILDDLHWADEASIQLLEFVATGPRQARLALLCAYRYADLPLGHPLLRTLATLERHYPGHTVELGGLSLDEVGSLMAAATGQQPNERVVAAVYDQTGGNPFLVQELSFVLHASGLPEQSLDSPGWGIALPRGARAVVLHSLDRLSSPCRRLLGAAAVVGTEFESRLLEQLAEFREFPLYETLEEATSAQVIVRVPGRPDRLAFRHALLREALYGQLLVVQRATLHRSIGEALEKIHGPAAEDHISELAYHFLEAVPAGASTAAVQYARRAADRAMALFAYEEAARLYEKALYAAAPDDANLRCELLLALGQARWDAGDPPGGRQAFQSAAAVAREQSDYQQFARAALGCGRSLTTIGTVDQPLVSLLEEALSGLPDEDSPLRAMVLASLARALYWSGPLERRRALSQHAVEMARRTADPQVLSHVLDAVWIALWVPENPEERREMATEMLRLAEETRDNARAHQAHRWRMIALLELGNVAEARDEFAAQMRIAREIQQPAQLENVSVVMAMWALLEGRFVEAEHLIADALTGAQQAHDPAAGEQFGAQMIALLRERGRLHEIEQTVTAFAEQNPAILAWRAVMAWVYSQQGREAEARREFDRIAGDEFACLHRDYTWLTAASLLADVCSFLGDHRRAAILYRQLSAFADRNAVMGYAIVCSGSVSRSLGVLAAVMRRRREAKEHFERALEMNEHMSARPWLAWTQYEYARMLHARGRPAQTKRAEDLLNRALGNARELGMGTLEQACLALMDCTTGQAWE